MNVFNFSDHKKLLAFLLDTNLGRGGRTLLAKELNCHPGFVSQALSPGKASFSTENLFRACRFLNLGDEETEFVLLLRDRENAGSIDLKNLFSKKITALQTLNLKVEKQVRTMSVLDPQSRAIYYSHWTYAAIHMAVGLPHLKTPQKISDRLGIPLDQTKSVLKMLKESGLVEEKKGEFLIGKTRIHLSKEDPLVRAHHQNYRLRAIQSLDCEKDFDLHYSSVMTLSKKDADIIRTLILDLIRAKETILGPSKDEELVCFSLDYYLL